MKNPGFTFVELLMVFLILGLVTIVTFPLLNTAVGRTELQTVSWELSDMLRRAQVQTMTGEKNDQWGVHLEADRYTLFKGNTYSFGASDNVIVDLPGRISLTGWSLNGGGDDIVFLAPRGRTDNHGTITLQDSTSLETIIITITAAGRITSS